MNKIIVSGLIMLFLDFIYLSIKDSTKEKIKRDREVKVLQEKRKNIENEMNHLLSFLGRRLKHFRKLHGYSQTYVHLNTGIAKSTISEIENGHCKDPKLSTLVTLTNFYEIDFSILTMKQNAFEEDTDVEAFRKAFDTLHEIYKKIK